jgi:hypothetical protein
LHVPGEMPQSDAMQSHIVLGGCNALGRYSTQNSNP